MVAILCMGSMCGAMAQVLQKQIVWEGQIGFNSSKMGDMGSKPGFHIGVKGSLDLPTLFDGAYVNAGAFISLKGSKIDMGDLGNDKITAGYLDIPIHFGYAYTFNDKLAVFGEVGPYIAIGLFGKHKVTEITDVDLDTGEFKQEEMSYNTFDDLKRFDMGLGLKFGVELVQKYTFSIGYDWGFIDVYKGSNLDAEHDTAGDIDLTPSAKNKNLTISLGYKF